MPNEVLKWLSNVFTLSTEVKDSNLGRVPEREN